MNISTIAPNYSFTPQTKKTNMTGRLSCESNQQAYFDSYGTREVLVQETSFFRDTKSLEYVMSYLEKNFKDKPNLKIYNGACSTGEETYTLKMLSDKLNKNVEIIGFDLGKNAIDTAQNGVFPITYDDSGFFRMINVSSYTDSYLAFDNVKGLDGKKLEYRNKFADSFVRSNKPDLEKEKRNRQTVSIFETLSQIVFPNGIVKLNLPKLHTVLFEPKKEVSKNVKFINANILNLDKFIEPGTADVLTFRNALYHLTTTEGKKSKKIPKKPEEVRHTLEYLFSRVSNALCQGGVFVLGNHPADHHKNGLGSVIYPILQKNGLVPIFFEDNCATVWKKV